MGKLMIRGVDDGLKRRLRLRAAQAGRSMEEEARCILREALAGREEPDGLGSRIHARILTLTGGLDLPLAPRSAPRPPPDFEDGGR